MFAERQSRPFPDERLTHVVVLYEVFLRPVSFLNPMMKMDVAIAGTTSRSLPWCVLSSIACGLSLTSFLIKLILGLRKRMLDFFNLSAFLLLIRIWAPDKGQRILRRLWLELAFVLECEKISNMPLYQKCRSTETEVDVLPLDFEIYHKDVVSLVAVRSCEWAWETASAEHCGAVLL